MKLEKIDSKMTFQIERRIYIIRGQKVMLDEDLAELYGVETRRLNEQVKRNMGRFPEDFMFQITSVEFENLKSQIAISSWGGRRKLPYAFTQNGIAMLSSVLNSEQAVKVNIQIMRTFTNLRDFMYSNHELQKKIESLEMKYDQQFKEVFDALREILNSPVSKNKKKIGF